jgi:hypothetical protein
MCSKAIVGETSIAFRFQKQISQNMTSKHGEKDKNPVSNGRRQYMGKEYVREKKKHQACHIQIYPLYYYI